MVVIALLHLFRVGTYLHGSFFRLHYAYFSDVIVPFGMYFLLCLADDRIPLLADWREKAILVFGVASATEPTRILSYTSRGSLAAGDVGR